MGAYRTWRNITRLAQSAERNALNLVVVGSSSRWVNLDPEDRDSSLQHDEMLIAVRGLDPRRDRP